ncbi:hypothetical protein O9992_00795 [Vibrio lentus]|nr:hypothetical protein [Vibrio lentus]
MNAKWTPKNITIENNSLVDTEWGIVYGKSKPPCKSIQQRRS